MTTPPQAPAVADDVLTANGRDIYECANQLGGYIGPDTPERLARFLRREASAATDLANTIARLSQDNETLRLYLSAWEDSARINKHRAETAEASLAAAQEQIAALRAALELVSPLVHPLDARYQQVDAALSTSPAGGGEPVAAQIKPLEWRGTEGVWAKADALFGATYRITKYAGMQKPFKFETIGFIGPSGHYELLSEAKAAAQADYEQRIRAALTTPQAPAPDWDKAVEAAFRVNHHPLAESSETERRKSLAALRAAAPHLGVREG